MTLPTLDQARAAKRSLAEMLGAVPELRGIGIAVLDGGFGVKVNLSAATAVAIPAEVDGVPVLIEVVGGISAL